MDGIDGKHLGLESIASADEEITQIAPPADNISEPVIEARALSPQSAKICPPSSGPRSSKVRLNTLGRIRTAINP